MGEYFIPFPPPPLRRQCSEQYDAILRRSARCYARLNRTIYDTYLRKFYASVNAVMAHSKFVIEDVKLRLFESFALPLLT